MPTPSTGKETPVREPKPFPESPEVNTERTIDKNAIDLSNDEALEAFQVSNSDDEVEGGGGEVEVVKKRKTSAYDTIQAMRKRSNVDTQAILNTTAELPKGMLKLINEKHTDNLTSGR